MRPPGICFVTSDALTPRGWRVSLLFEDGCFPTGEWPCAGGGQLPWFVPGPTYDEALEQVQEMNVRRGVDVRTQRRIIAESVRRAA